jgi:hypothetical protein
MKDAIFKEEDEGDMIYSATCTPGLDVYESNQIRRQAYMF